MSEGSAEQWVDDVLVMGRLAAGGQQTRGKSRWIQREQRPVF